MMIKSDYFINLVSALYSGDKKL